MVKCMEETKITYNVKKMRVGEILMGLQFVQIAEKKRGEKIIN